MRELLAGLVPGSPATTARSIVARADGIPLYAVETVRMLVADGPAARGRRTPATSRSASSASSRCRRRSRRSSRLASTACRPRTGPLLQDAAVLGPSFTLAGLSAVTEQTPEAIANPRLRVLVDMELGSRRVGPRLRAVIFSNRSWAPALAYSMKTS